MGFALHAIMLLQFRYCCFYRALRYIM